MEIYGIRSIIEAIESSKEISKVYLIKSSAQSSLLKSLLSLLEKESIKYSFIPKERFNKYKNKNHQGAVAILSPISLLSIEELILKTYKKNENQIYLLFLLDNHALLFDRKKQIKHLITFLVNILVYVFYLYHL